jgi:hypothetical protein
VLGEDGPRRLVVVRPNPVAVPLVGQEVGRLRLDEQPPLLEDPDPVAETRHLDQLVAREQDRLPPLVGEVDEEAPDLLDALRVEPVRRLVEQQERRVAEQGAGDAEPLPHSLGVASDPPVAVRREPDRLEKPVRRGAGLAPREAVRDAEQRQVPAAGEPRVERRSLDQTTLAGARLPGVAGRVEPVHEHRPGIRPDEPQRDPERRGLPRAVVSREAVPVAGTDVKRDVVERHVAAEAFGDRMESQQRAPGSERSSIPRRVTRSTCGPNAGTLHG